VKLLFSRLHIWIHLQFVLDDISAYSNESEVDHGKVSLFLSRKASSSSCSSGLVSVSRQIALSGTLGSSLTFLKSSLASMAF
jgi:hypothetical protein